MIQPRWGKIDGFASLPRVRSQSLATLGYALQPPSG
jgi:hypothetical protein